MIKTNELEVDYEEISVNEKRCSKCWKVKHLSQFTKVKKLKNGIGGVCSVCTNKRSTDRYRRDEEYRQTKIMASRKYRQKKNGKLH